ncbi:MAG TPA: pyridoxamine 5'-phosphate oxidase family protein [Nocardioidaceae bacterium]|jgi:PPOX class probable F420-dependent enzyme|nr:pyridoxamine 5'-phosphate oxidase family protein [Nocardioidaceae bacterium]
MSASDEPSQPKRSAEPSAESSAEPSADAPAASLLPPEVAERLAQPNPAVIAHVRPDGQPVSVATWYLLDGDRVLVNMDESRRRLDYIRHDPRVTLTALDAEDWYTHISLQGRVVELVEDTDLVDIDRLSTHYTGSAYPTRDRGRVSAWIVIEAWHGWGAARRS